jgi:hypothetical protein
VLRWWHATVPVHTPMVSVCVRRTRSRSPTVGTCCGTRGDAVCAIAERCQVGIRKMSKQIADEATAQLPTEPFPVHRPAAVERLFQEASARRQAR